MDAFVQVPTIFDSFSKHVDGPKGSTVDLLLWDTAGQEDYDRLRPLCYPETDVFIICFSLIQPSSGQNAFTKWGPELMHHLRGRDDVPIMLVGTKLDLRDDVSTMCELANKGLKPLQYSDGLRIAKDLSALCVMRPVEYFECSALTQRGLKNVFERAVTLVVDPKARNAWRKKGKGGRKPACALM